MAMTTRSTLPAAQVQLLPDDADAVEIQTGSDAEPTTVLVAGRDHFRVLDDERTVLYLRGALIPPEHAEAPSVDAELNADGGGYQPNGPERAGVQLGQRDTGQPTEMPTTKVQDTVTGSDRAIERLRRHTRQR